MDDLEFRRRILADPKDRSLAMCAAKNSSVTNRKLHNELQQLDSKLAAVMKVDVPEDLADRILFRQSGQGYQAEKKVRRHLAIAASVAFFGGLLLGKFIPDAIPGSSPDIGQIALTHIYNEAPFVNQIDEGVSLTQVNAKLKPFGPTLSTLPSHVYYLNHCGFNGGDALHMVLHGQHGKITVFVVPQPSKNMTSFEDNNMNGVVMPSHDASLIVVGNKGENIMPIAEKLQKAMHWQDI
ncbi:DUF3379 domain-containing protein [Photobacterium sp. GJ3]|uniref:DUF3379 domain-containing protein n=1 Tax=Photobacterium sp. GJ3 TaxID=2829502 RepID=UPI001B8BD2C3|nr:DUF3379 domain-containing protein [Photobacterium sp. GJ3]QUJ66665.1 DUF3379 domain-containing protein [Photobacterium sp. GJ3]